MVMVPSKVVWTKQPAFILPKLNLFRDVEHQKTDRTKLTAQNIIIKSILSTILKLYKIVAHLKYHEIYCAYS